MDAHHGTMDIGVISSLFPFPFWSVTNIRAKHGSGPGNQAPTGVGKYLCPHVAGLQTTAKRHFNVMM